ncbi:hypothetical protein MTO96_029831 [Rhipicephalus appendiculatus]
MREDLDACVEIAAGMWLFRTIAEALLAWRLGTRQALSKTPYSDDGCWPTATIATAASGFALQAVFRFKANEQPRAHAAAVVVYGVLVLVARWTNVLGFSVFRTPAVSYSSLVFR